MKTTIRNIFITFFGVGLSPFAPGSVATLVAIATGYLIYIYLGIETLFLMSLLVTVAGIKEIDKYEKESGSHDESKIVIDEVAGTWLCMSMTFKIEPTWLWLILVFITFRFFDIAKPSVIGRIDRNMAGGKGVMLDDIVAGFFAGIMCLIIYSLVIV